MDELRVLDPGPCGTHVLFDFSAKFVAPDVVIPTGTTLIRRLQDAASTTSSPDLDQDVS